MKAGDEGDLQQVVRQWPDLSPSSLGSSMCVKTTEGSGERVLENHWCRLSFNGRNTWALWAVAAARSPKAESEAGFLGR